MHLETMPRGRGLSVVGDGAGQEMILDIRVLNAGTRADETGGFKVIGGAETGLEQQPLQADQPL